MFDIEYPYIVCCADNGAIVRVGHELHREDVGPVTRLDRSGEAELRGGRFGVVRVDIDAMVIRARGK